MKPDPYDVLGVSPAASDAEIAAAYRRAVRDCHPDTARHDPERLAAVIAAYQRLRDRHAESHGRQGTAIPVHVRQTSQARKPDLRAGPVRHHET
jgi:DnaJ-class molecular chaperone